MVLPNEEWHTEAEDARDQLIADLRRVLKEGTVFDLVGWNRRLTQLRQHYMETYTQLHQQAVLGPQEETRRKKLKSDPRYIRLATLAHIDKMNVPRTTCLGTSGGHATGMCRVPYPTARIPHRSVHHVASSQHMW